MVWGLVTDLSKLDLTNVIQIGLSQEIHILLDFLMEHITDI